MSLSPGTPELQSTTPSECGERVGEWGLTQSVGEAAFDSPLCPAHRLIGKDRPFGVAKGQVSGDLMADAK